MISGTSTTIAHKRQDEHIKTNLKSHFQLTRCSILTKCPCYKSESVSINVSVRGWFPALLLSFSNHVTSNRTVKLKTHSPCASSLVWAAHLDPAEELSVKDYQASTHTQTPAFIIYFLQRAIYLFILQAFCLHDYKIICSIPQIRPQKRKHICEWLCVLDLF